MCIASKWTGLSLKTSRPVDHLSGLSGALLSSRQSDQLWQMMDKTGSYMIIAWHNTSEETTINSILSGRKTPSPGVSFSAHGLIPNPPFPPQSSHDASAARPTVSSNSPIEGVSGLHSPQAAISPPFHPQASLSASCGENNQ